MSDLIVQVIQLLILTHTTPIATACSVITVNCIVLYVSNNKINNDVDT